MNAASRTRQSFDRWLKGETVDVSAELFAPETSAVVPEQVLPADLRGVAYAISCFRSESRWTFLDRVCRRLKQEGRAFLSDPTDSDAVEWQSRFKAIRRDVHKAHAFVRFKEVPGESERFAAWHRPQHDTLDLFVRLFCRRFPKMAWSIFTTEESAHLSAQGLRFDSGMPEEAFRLDDEWEEYWREYYGAIYNPARLMVRAMKKEMPVHHWRTLPEARRIPELIRDTRPRLARMAALAQSSAEPFLPTSDSLESLAAALDDCRGCRLGTQCRPTAGRGNARARLVLVGEQPGDEEEKAGEPFIGPAGQILRRAAAESKLDWNHFYVTNAVKHFKYAWRGPRRLHQRPERDEIAACRPWLTRELALIQPQIVLCLGASAAFSLTGRLWPIERYRGSWLPTSAPYRVLLTYHPSAILRAPAKAMEYYQALVEDLRLAAG